MDELSLGLEYLAFKSTIDRMAHTIGESLNFYSAAEIKVAEIDDSSLFEEVLKGANAAVLYRLKTFLEHPRRPRFTAEFSVSLKTRGDSGNLLMSSLVNAASAQLRAETRFDVCNYLDTNTPKLGSGLITFSTVARQEFDKDQGVRTILCRAVAAISGGDG